MTDYRQYYDLEKYLFDTVGPNFRKTGQISRRDFYLILIWKANRAKNYVPKRFSKMGISFKDGVERIAKGLHENEGLKAKLKILMSDWGFLLPTATAILTVFYPCDFSVYDVRVIKQLRKIGANVTDSLNKLRSAPFSDKLWDGYLIYLGAVKAETPAEYSLRDRDRFLWARSFIEEVQNKLPR
jgi:hypothetical protein